MSRSSRILVIVAGIAAFSIVIVLVNIRLGPELNSPAMAPVVTQDSAVRQRLAIEPSVAVNQDVLYTVWTEKDNSTGRFDLMFSKIDSEGRALRNPLKLTDSQVTSFPHEAQVAVAGNTVNIIWSSHSRSSPADIEDIYYMRSTDGGATFEKEILVTNESRTDFSGSPLLIKSDNHNIAVLWKDRNLHMALTRIVDDSGIIINEAARITNTTSLYTQAISKGSYLYIFSLEQDDDGSNSGYFLRTSKDNGKSFSDQVQITRRGTSFDLGASCAENDNHVYIVWNDDNPRGQTDILLRISADGGMSFGDPINVSNNSPYSGFPQIEVSSCNGESGDDNSDLLSIVWSDFTMAVWNTTTGKLEEPERHEISFATLVGGEHTGGYSNLRSDPSIRIIANGSDPRIAISENYVYVAWRWFSGNSTSPDLEIFLSRSIDGGRSFSTPVNLSNTTGSSIEPVILSSGNHVFLVWSEEKRTPRMIEGGGGQLIESNILAKMSEDAGDSFSKRISVG